MSLTEATYRKDVREAIKAILSADSWIGANVATIEDELREDAFISNSLFLAFGLSELPGIQIGLQDDTSEMIATNTHDVTVPVVIYLVNRDASKNIAQDYAEQTMSRIKNLMREQISADKDFNGIEGMFRSVTGNSDYIVDKKFGYIFYSTIVVHVSIIIEN